LLFKICNFPIEAVELGLQKLFLLGQEVSSSRVLVGGVYAGLYCGSELRVSGRTVGSLLYEYAKPRNDGAAQSSEAIANCIGAGLNFFQALLRACRHSLKCGGSLIDELYDNR